MRLFLDTNIVIDHMQKREPFAKSARMLMILGYLGEFELWMGASQVTDAFYILSNGGKPQHISVARQKLLDLRKTVRLCSLSEADVDATLLSAWIDFEDACVYQCACKTKADVIVTRNKADFARSSIRVMDCEELFDYLEKEKSLVYDEVEF